MSVLLYFSFRTRQPNKTIKARKWEFKRIAYSRVCVIGHPTAEIILCYVDPV